MKRTASLAMALIVIWAISLGAQTKKSEAAAGGAKSKAATAKKTTETKLSSPDSLDWMPAKRLPAGAQVAVLEGDPMKAGPYTMRLKLPAGYKIPPHWHSSPEHVTVLSGALRFAMGKTWDDSKLNDVPAGAFAVIAAHDAHYGTAKEDTILQSHGMGPWEIHYVNPADDPEHKK